MGNQQSNEIVYKPTFYETLKKLEESNPDFFVRQKTNIFKFFWLSNDDPDKEEDTPIWTPYEQDDNLFLEYSYEEYLKGKEVSPQIGDYIIDFQFWYQYHYKYTSRQRRITREDPAKIKLVYRKSRFDTNPFPSNFQDIDIEKISVVNETKKIGFVQINISKQDISSEINNKYITMNFNVLPGKEIKFLLLKSFYEKMTISLDKMDLNTLKKNLNKELDLYADSIHRYNIYKIKYLYDMDENNFCNYILKMYTEEGFLYKVVNKILREKDLSEFQKVQYYYICILAAFEHSSSGANEKILTDPLIPDDIKKNINFYKKFHLYRGAFLTEKEITYLEKNSPIIRIHNEFLSCTLMRDVALGFAKTKNCLIELEVEFKNLNHKNYFTFLHSDLSVYETEREILLKSGSIIFIDSFGENSNQIGPKYIIKGRVISFDQKELYRCIIKEFNQKKLDLSNNSIGSNPDDMKYLSDALKDNKTITELDLSNNSIGSNPNNMKYLSEALKENKTLTRLYLSDNSIGSKPENVKFFSEALKENKSITGLYLSDNSIGSNPENMQYFSEALKENKYITGLYLSYNSIGFNSDDMKSFSQALKENKSITGLDLSYNFIGSNPDNIKYLSEVLKWNKTITGLYLSNNSIGQAFIENLKSIRNSVKIFD